MKDLFGGKSQSLWAELRSIRASARAHNEAIGKPSMNTEWPILLIAFAIIAISALILASYL